MYLPSTIAWRSVGAMSLRWAKISDCIHIVFLRMCKAVDDCYLIPCMLIWGCCDPLKIRYRTFFFCICDCSLLPAAAGMLNRMLRLERESPLRNLISSFILFIFSTRSLIKLDRSPVFACCCSLLLLCASASAFCGEICLGFFQRHCKSLKVLIYYYSGLN